MAEVAHAWGRQRPAVASTIIGTRTTDQRLKSLRVAGLELSAEENAVLDKLSDLRPSD